MTKRAFLMALAVFAVGGAGAPPATAPSVTEPLSRVELEAIVKGEPADGINALRGPIKAFPKNAEMLGAMGYLHLKAKRFPEALQFLDRAAASGSDGKEVVFNRALACVRTGNEVKASATVAAYLQANPAAADECLVTIFGDSNARVRKGLSAKINSNIDGWEELYRSRLAALEATKGGQHMWGSKWLDNAQYAAVSGQVQAAKDKLALAETALAKATENRVEADDDYKAAQARVPDANKPRDTWAEQQRDSAKARLKQMQTIETNAKTARDGAKKAIAVPAWDGTYVPIWA